jgi:Glycosyltransferase family 87
MKPRIWLALSLVAAVIASLYAMRVVGPWGEYRDEVRNGIKAQMGDLYPRWLGTRELLLRGLNPYGPEVSHEIQMAYYGRILDQDYGQPAGKIVDEQRFAYPVYVVFLMAPTIYADFVHLRLWVRFALGLLTGISILLSVNLLARTLPWEIVTALVLFTLSSAQIVQGLRFEQLALLVGFLLIGGAWCAGRHHLKTAGVLLALSTIKPQMALIPLCWFVVWTLGDWLRRWRLTASLVITLIALCAAGEFILSGWFGYFLAGLVAYRKYFPTTSLLRVVLGDTLGEIMGSIIILGLLILAWRNRECAADAPEFTSVFAAFLMGTVLAFPLFTPFNQVLLIFPTLLLIRDWNALPSLSRLAFIVMVSWPWITSLLLLLFPPQVHSLDQLPLLPSFLVLFFPLFLPLFLATRRRPAAVQLPVSDLRTS